MTTIPNRFAQEIREHTIRCIGHLGMGHIGGALSIADALAVLYGGEMRIDPKNPDWPERDRLVLSKGHAGPALYATLALKGYFPLSMLETLNRPGTMLPSHCDMNRTPGIDMTTGSLGQGLSAAVGMALGARLQGRTCRIFCILGDGDTQEGQTWEAAMYAAQQRLGRLVALTDVNGLQIDDRVDSVNSLGDLQAKWQAFGWNALWLDGHDTEAIGQAIRTLDMEDGKPHMLLLKTVKGKGVPFMENRIEFHHAKVSPEMTRQALELLLDGGASE